MEVENIFENIYCKGEMSNRALNLLLKYNDSHSSVAVWDGFVERGYSLFKRSNLSLDRSYSSYTKQNAGNGIHRQKFLPFPTASLESDTG
jgi:hypothetical protein